MITFLDGVCPKPYTGTTLRTEGMGGTEATVVRISEALVSNAISAVNVQQRGRTEAEVVYGVTYTPVDKPTGSVVVLRDPRLAIEVAKYNKKGRTYLWMHDLADNSFAELAPELRNLGILVISVSDFHKHQILDIVKRNTSFAGPLYLKTVYNPVDDSYSVDETQYDKNKLVFTASPHKGLEGTLKLFQLVKQNFNPDFTLHIFNPGYYPDINTDIPGVVVHGSKPHHEVIKHVRESLAVFYINTVFPETFGLILAEANAVGTPFITHLMGAANEVSSHPNQVMDVRDAKAVINRLMTWHQGYRPIVALKKEFRMSNVIQSWKKLLS